MTGWTVDHFFLEMNGVFSNRDLISLLWDEWHLAGDAISAYKLTLFHNVLLAIPIVIAFCMPPERPISLARYWAVLPGSALICVAGADQLCEFRCTVISSSVFACVNCGAINARRRRKSSFLRISPPEISTVTVPSLLRLIKTHRFKKTIMVMDESVRGDRLSLNNAQLNTTPFLKSEPRLINFGIAISGGNCSAISRAIFRYGLRSYHLSEQMG